MAEIFLLNPVKKKRNVNKRKPKKKTASKKTAKKKEKKAMAKKKTTKKKPVKYTTVSETTSYRSNPKKRRYKKNPVGLKLMGLDLAKAGIGAVQGQPGILAAQFFSKSFARESLQSDDLEWKTIALALGGALSAGILGKMINNQVGSKSLEHGMSYILNRVINDKVIKENDTLSDYLAGDYLNPSVTSEMVEYDMYGNRIQPGNTATLGELTQRDHLGGQIVDKGALGAVDSQSSGSVIDMYAKAFER